MTVDVIEDLETYIVELPTRRRHGFAYHAVRAMRYLLLRIRTRAGVEGWGEAGPPGGPWWGGESVETCQALVTRYFWPVLEGRAVNEAGKIGLALDKVVAGNPFAKAAVDMALHDAWARGLGIPVADLLGGIQRTRFDVRWALSSGPVEPILEEVERMGQEGFRSFKLKMGACPVPDDLARVERILAAAEPHGPLLGDPNGAWTLAEAAMAAPRLEAMGLEALEQPLPRSDRSGLRRLRDILLRLPLIADESVCGPVDALDLAAGRDADYVALKYAKCGGLRRGAETAAIVCAANLGVYGGTALETSLGTAAQLHLLSASPRLDFGTELVGPTLLEEDIVQVPLIARAGELELPSGPGLGVEVDLERVRARTQEKETC